jgi:hypothetical protein
MKSIHKLLIVLALLLVSASLIYVHHAKKHLDEGKSIIIMHYSETRAWAQEQKANATFYFADTMPASIHANYPHTEENGQVKWHELLRTKRLYGTRFDKRVHVNFAPDGRVSCFYTDAGGEKMAGATPIPSIELFNRVGQKIRFNIDGDGTIHNIP